MATATTPDPKVRTTPDGFTIEKTDDGLVVTLPDGVDVEVPSDYADHKFTSEAARLSLHRRYPTYRRTRRAGTIEDVEVRPDPFQFEGGVFPHSGRTLSPAEYAELVTHPFYGRKCTLLVRPAALDGDAPARPEPASTPTDEILAILERRAEAGDAQAQAALGWDQVAEDGYDEPEDDEPEDDGTTAPPPKPNKTEPPQGKPDAGDPSEGESKPPETVTFDEVGKGDAAAAFAKLKEHAAATGQKLDEAALKTKAGNLSVVEIREAAVNLGAEFPNL